MLNSESSMSHEPRSDHLQATYLANIFSQLLQVRITYMRNTHHELVHTVHIVSTPAKLHLVNYAPDRAIMMKNCSLLISFLMMCRLLQSVRASGRMKGVTGADWASFCLRRVATSVYRRKGEGGGGGGWRKRGRRRERWVRRAGGKGCRIAE